MPAFADHLLDSERADQLFIDEQSVTSDDTVFLELPLPPVPHLAVQVHNVDQDNIDGSSRVIVMTDRMYSRMDDFDMAPPRQSPELSADSSNVSDWSSSDEDTSFYQDRERLSQFRCTESMQSKDCKTSVVGNDRLGIGSKRVATGRL